MGKFSQCGFADFQRIWGSTKALFDRVRGNVQVFSAYDNLGRLSDNQAMFYTNITTNFVGSSAKPKDLKRL